MKNCSSLLGLCEREWGEVVLEDQEMLVRRKGEPQEQSVDLCPFQSQIHTRRFRSIKHLLVSQDGKFVLMANRLEFADDPRLLHSTAQKECSV